MTQPSALPTFWEMHAPEEWSSVDFISDLHLSSDTPRTFDAWSSHLRHTAADAVFILGDLFDVWIGDDSRSTGFEARCVDVLADAATTRTLAFMAGNRDFLVGGEMLKACGMLALPDPAVMIAFGERLLLSHGDALCTSDVEYQRFRVQVRSAQWQADFLARPLAERRAIARDLREQSRRRKANQPPGEWFDVNSAAAVCWMHESGTATLVHGHTHRPGSESLAPGFTRHVLSDWDLDDVRAPRAQVLRWRRSGLTRIAPSPATGAPRRP